MYDLIELGHRCKHYRQHKLCITQSQLADITGYSKQAISAFETGRTNNAQLLLWYINNGFPTSELRGCEYGKTARTYCAGVKRAGHIIYANVKI